MTKTDGLEELKKLRVSLNSLLHSAKKLQNKVESFNSTDEAIIRIENSIDKSVTDISTELTTITRQIQDLEFEVNRTADFEGGY